MAVVYEELRRVARRRLRAERADHSLAPTAPVAYDDRTAHSFFAIAARLMRQILVVLRFFGGMTVEEAAEGLGLSPATVKRDWSRGRWTQAEGPHPPCTHRTNDRE